MVFPTSDCHDCGGRCVLNLHIAGGVIERIETDRGPEPQYRACAKGRAYRQMVYAPERLKYPLKRVGKRGSGNFTRISWDEALDSLAGEMKRVRHDFGAASILLVPGSGYGGAIGGMAEPARHVLCKFGGYTIRWGSPSAEGSRFSSRATYGTMATAHSRDDLLNARLILMWGWNPAVSLHGVNTKLHLYRAREKGVRIVSIDPRYNDTAAIFAHRWLAIRPGTDAAALVAMAHTIITRGLANERFIRLFVHGYEEFRAYVLGDEDGVAKTPEWAEPITGLAAADIRELAIDYATLKPAALMSGYAPGRTAGGEQFHRAAAALAAITGNIGMPGGNPAGHNLLAGPRLRSPANPLEPSPTAVEDSHDPAFKSRYRVHGADLWRALCEGKKGGFPADFKLLYVIGANPINQMPNSSEGLRALAQTEFVAVQDIYLSTTARQADLVLPAAGHVEHTDVYRPSYPEDYYMYLRPAIKPYYECLSDMEIARRLAQRLGVDYYENASDEELFERYLELPAVKAEIADPTELREKAIVRLKRDRPRVAFEKETRGPGSPPFPTPSGKIELYSSALAALGNPAIPPIPKYIDPWEGPAPAGDPYPLQLISTHSLRRANSCFDRVPWLRELEPHTIMVNEENARERGILEGDRVRVTSPRGTMLLTARISGRIRPGVADISQGAWLDVNEEGVEVGGCSSFLLRDQSSPGGAYPYNTCRIEISKVS